MALDDVCVPDAAVGFNSQQASDFVVETVANEAGRPDPTVAKICYQSDTGAIYVCTVAA
jgi:hypothetical protein